MLQVTECPDDVRLLSRMALISDAGVVLGASIECDLILPNMTVEQENATVYFEVKPDKQSGQYKLSSHLEGVTVNQRAQIANSTSTLSDGDVIAVFGYTLLFSNDDQASGVNKDSESSHTNDSQFYDTVSAVEFDASNIFADLESELDDISQQKIDSENDEFVDYQAYDAQNVSVNNDVNNSVIEKKLDKLIEVSQNPWLQQKQLLMMLDGVVDEFLKEFDPNLIEDMVGPPSRWNTKQWKAYKQYYQRKLDEGHFKRQFKALLIECMQK